MQQKQFSTRRRRMRSGFTLLELILVVSLIAILARIALPNFVGGKDKAYQDAMQSDLRNYASAAEMYYEDFDKYPTAVSASTASSTTSMQFTNSDDVSLAIGNVTQAGYTVVSTHTKLSATKCWLVVSSGTGARVDCGPAASAPATS